MCYWTSCYTGSRHSQMSEEFISEEQAGFRADRSTVQQILSLRLIAEKYMERHLKKYTTASLIKSIWLCLARWALGCYKSYGIDGKLIKLMQAIYSEARSTGIVIGMHSDWLQMSVGSRQGDPLSPRTFTLLLERIMGPVKEMQNIGAKSVRNTDKQ